jgi:cysteinyl-tRNA synthetase
MIQFHNTLTARKEPFVSAKPNEARMYVCGITPYDSCHVGHARCYVVFDVLRRMLKAHGYAVRFVQNFTDVDDKIIDRARERNITPGKLVDDNIEDFFNKMDALGVQRADLYPKVTGHIPDIIALIQKLIDNKSAYTLNGDVYFSVRSFPSYGKLSKRNLDDLQSGARVEVNQEKRDPLDFALWKAAKPDEPAEVIWDAPWGKGRPGWHIECSVMALKHLGETFDIHGGGRDLIFPHHENEIAQSEAATHTPFARFWLHNGFVTVNQEKMSKSLGNFFTLTDIFKQYHPSVVRYMLLTVHYRSPLDFSTDILEQSRHTLANLKDAVGRMTHLLRKLEFGLDDDVSAAAGVEKEAAALLAEFKAALADDLNTPAALGVLHQMIALAERQFHSNTIHRASIRAALDQFHAAAEILGLDLVPSTRDVLIPGHVTAMAQERQAAREQKNWKESDRLRQAISEAGYVVEDTPQGPRLLPKASG